MFFDSQSTANSEKQLKFSPDQKDIDVAIKEVPDQQQKDAIKNILLRNRALRLLHSLLFTTRNTVNTHLCEDISRILGLDWVLLLFQPQIHSSTVILGRFLYFHNLFGFRSFFHNSISDIYSIQNFRYANFGCGVCK